MTNLKWIGFIIFLGLLVGCKPKKGSTEDNMWAQGNFALDAGEKSSSASSSISASQSISKCPHGPLQDKLENQLKDLKSTVLQYNLQDNQLFRMMSYAGSWAPCKSSAYLESETFDRLVLKAHPEVQAKALLQHASMLGLIDEDLPTAQKGSGGSLGLADSGGSLGLLDNKTSGIPIISLAVVLAFGMANFYMDIKNFKAASGAGGKRWGTRNMLTNGADGAVTFIFIATIAGCMISQGAGTDATANTGVISFLSVLGYADVAFAALAVYNNYKEIQDLRGGGIGKGELGNIVPDAFAGNIKTDESQGFAPDNKTKDYYDEDMAKLDKQIAGVENTLMDKYQIAPGWDYKKFGQVYYGDEEVARANEELNTELVKEDAIKGWRKWLNIFGNAFLKVLQKDLVLKIWNGAYHIESEEMAKAFMSTKLNALTYELRALEARPIVDEAGNVTGYAVPKESAMITKGQSAAFVLNKVESNPAVGGDVSAREELKPIQAGREGNYVKVADIQGSGSTRQIKWTGLSDSGLEVTGRADRLRSNAAETFSVQAKLNEKSWGSRVSAFFSFKGTIEQAASSKPTSGKAYVHQLSEANARKESIEEEMKNHLIGLKKAPEDLLERRNAAGEIVHSRDELVRDAKVRLGVFAAAGILDIVVMALGDQGVEVPVIGAAGLTDSESAVLKKQIGSVISQKIAEIDSTTLAIYASKYGLDLNALTQ